MSANNHPALRRMGLRLRRILPRIGLVLLVLVVLVAIPWTYFNIKWGRELEAKLAELKAQGMPLTMAEAAPKPVPDAQNATVLYQKVFGQFSSGDVSKHRHIGGMTDEEQRIFWEYTKTGDTALQAQVRDILSRPGMKRDLQLIRQAAQRPYSVFPINWEEGARALFPHLSCFRNAVHVLAAQAQACAEAGHLAEALDWCAVGLRMSEQAASEPTLIAQLVGISMQAMTFDAVEEILSERELDPSTANEFAEYLSRIDLKKTFTAAMIGERALGRWCFEQLLKEGCELLKSSGPSPCPFDLRLYASWLGSPVQKLDQLTYLTYKGGVIEASKLPYREGEDQLEAQRRALARLPTYRAAVTKLLSPVFSRATQKRDWAIANIALCRVALALKAYKYERGVYPDNLGQLQSTLDWALPEAPFSGPSLVYHRQGDGFQLYSSGPDLEDDGGVPERDEQGKRRDDADIVWACSR